MSSVSSARTDLATSFPSTAAEHPVARETLWGIAVVAVLLAAAMWGAFAQAHSQPLPGDLGPEAALSTMVD